MRGLPVLRQALAAHSERHAGLQLNWRTDILVTSGASEALAAAFLALLNAGDEVVVFAPLYDSYLPMLRRAGATARVVQLHSSSGWGLDPAELEAAFSPATKLCVLNTPHNPTGKVRALGAAGRTGQRRLLAACWVGLCLVGALLCCNRPPSDCASRSLSLSLPAPRSSRETSCSWWLTCARSMTRWRCWMRRAPAVTAPRPARLFGCGGATSLSAQLASCSMVPHVPSISPPLWQVYEHLIHPGAAHVSLASLPGMASRCLRVGSAGKTFSFTAWKVGREWLLA